MTIQPLRELLLQSDSEGTATIFNEFLRGAARLALFDLMQEEVDNLCGPSHDRALPRPANRRAGNEKGICYIDGGKEAIQRPRVRRDRGDGSEEEVHLASYKAAHQVSNIQEHVADLLLEGVSTRGASRLGGSTVSKSTISEQWIERSAEKLEEFRTRPLADDGYVALMIDGVFLSKDQTAIVALGIRNDGSKEMLDFKVGSSESAELAKALIGSLQKRGFKCVAKRLLAVLDGSSALENAILAYFPTAIIQRCLVHKERNLQSYLSKRHHGELARLLTRLRRAEGKDAAKEAYDELYGFLEEHNAAALESLKEAGKTITALQDLGVPATLHRSLLSTNIIENSILNIRRKMSKVNRWRAETKMPDRYLAAGLLYAESTFRKISGHKDLAKLVEALNAN